MSLPVAKREQVANYITELVARNEPHLNRKVQETFGLSRTSVSRYINKLLEEKVLQKADTQCHYQLVEQVHQLSQSLIGPHANEDTLYQQFRPYIQDFPEQAKSNFGFIFLEMMNNALEHSGASRVKATMWVNPIRLRGTIVDNGIGIFQRIRKFFRDELNEEISSEDAKLQLVSGGFTSDRGRHGGEGIYNSSLIADSFAIRSENLIFARNYELIDSFGISLKTRQKGTCVYFSVHRDTQKTLAGATHANPDDGFFRVTLPLKQMTLTGTALIARSQARRFTFNFIDKREVVLDFEGITELCQPFAHELFSVYHKAHPEVKLITRNTTEAMDRLIQRLMAE